MSIHFTQPQYHHQERLPSMDQDDSCSDTDTDTVIYTPTSLQSTTYNPSSWFSPQFDNNKLNNTIHPLQRPLSLPALSDAPTFKSKSTMDYPSFNPPRISPPPPPLHHETIDQSADEPSADHYHSTIRRMSQHIDGFLQSRRESAQRRTSLKTPCLEHGPSSVTGHLTEMIHQFRNNSNPDPHQAQQLCDTMLTWLQHSTLETEKKKNKRLVHAIGQLAQRHHVSKQAHRHALKTARREHAGRLQKETQTRKEAEDIVDSMRVEMEAMMGELNTAKQQAFTAEQEVQHIRDQWTSLIRKDNMTASPSDDNDDQVDPWALLAMQQDDWEHRMAIMTDQLHRLTKENEDRHELQRRLVQAERQAAEADLKWVVLKSQQSKQQQQQQLAKEQDEKNELITALQHELLDKTSTLARWEKKWQQQTKQWQQQQAALHQSHLADQQAWQDEYKAGCQKEKDLDLVRITRDTRALEGELVDISLEKERLQSSVVELQQRWHRMEQQNKAREAAWASKQSQWDRLEKETKATVLALEQKVIGLEADIVRLYGKNIILANQLGECD